MFSKIQEKSCGICGVTGVLLAMQHGANEEWKVDENIFRKYGMESLHGIWRSWSSCLVVLMFMLSQVELCHFMWILKVM
jgi:hypothetical protein